MRRRAVRLGRSFRRIVLSVAAAPLGIAVTAACSAESADDGPVDATVAEAAPNGPDADVGRDAGDVGDATIGDSSIDRAKDATAAADREGCGAIPLDGMIENTQDGCVSFGLLPCGLPPTAQREGCLVDLVTCIPLCNGAEGVDASYFLYCQLAPVSCNDAGELLDAQSVIECLSCNGITGRRPIGLLPARLRTRTPLGDYFASMAHLEAASVRAFRDLGRWLDAHGAPRRLSREAHRFVRDERLHARAARRLARRFGGVPARPRVRRTPVPTLFALLEDDAVEGCVKETFGALLATWQAEHAADARVRRTLRRIAADETRHAALAWEVLAWGLRTLSARARHQVEQALMRAVLALESGEHPAVHRAVRQIAGHPEAAEERRLASAFARVVQGELAALRLKTDAE